MTDRDATLDRFADAFIETTDSYRIARGDDVIQAPMPDGEVVARATELLVTTLFDVLRDTRLEAMADRIAWGIVHSFHKVAGQIEGEADKAAMAVRRLIEQNDGSEIGSVELEEAQMLCQSLDETQDALACMRDYAAATYHAETGRPWSAPRASLVSSKRTAPVVAATDYLAARRKRHIDARAPKGPVVIFSGGQVWEDHRLLYAALDSIKVRVPTMVLATTGQDKGCDAIAAAWAARTVCRSSRFQTACSDPVFASPYAWKHGPEFLGISRLNAAFERLNRWEKVRSCDAAEPCMFSIGDQIAITG
ncbi:SLOG family protein (plasmid) [Sphingobium sp. V4]|uniref:SLOG family protein n=1 Tax=Sphingobium sp. V4 TaxID=3038927 RepID=UPI0025580F19|nr:SLOG family protein [Sphingobium sp. V4]WIW91090.1 SLOG family protein [Sphingobium sp. V4]